MLKARGLYTFSNYFSSIPEGALLEAENVVIDRDGVIEPRRGIKDYGTVGLNTASPVEQMFVYKDRILAYANGQLRFDNNSGVFTAFTTDGTNPFVFSPPSTYRVKGIETQGNFYFLSDNGVKKISLKDSSDFITTPGSVPTVGIAGGVRSIDISVALDLTTVNGFLPAGSTVAYRIVWGTKDNNSNLILGFPSNNTQIYNSSSVAYGTEITIQVPGQLLGNSNYFYQVYRSSVVTTQTANDELRLVYEAPYDGVATVLQVKDNTPEDIRDNGVPLYTNEYSGEGILQANSAPPFCTDITLYKNITFYSNTRGKQSLEITLQGMDGLDEFTSIAATGAKIVSAVFSSGNTTFTLDGIGHDMPTGVSQEVVLVIDNANAPVILVANFPNAFDIVVPGDFTSFTLSDISIFPSYADVTYDSPTTSKRFYFVGRPSSSLLHCGSAKASMAAYSSFKLHSADNLIKYLFWYKINTSDVLPDILIDSGYIPTVIDITDAGITTAAQIAGITRDVLNDTGSFVSYIDTGTPEDVVIATSDSGVTNGTTATFKVLPQAAWTIAQTRDGVGEDETLRFVKLSSFVSVGQAIESTSKSFAKIVNRNITDLNVYYASSLLDLPGKLEIEVIDYITPIFKITSNIKDFVSGALGTGSMFNPNLDTSTTTTPAFSSSETNYNRLYFSKDQQPESVPALNFLDIGPKDKQILRIVALRDSLFVFKEEGIYRLTGTSSQNFNVALFDSSSNIVAPDTASVLNNQIYMLSSQGVATVTETGVGIVSRPIENIFTRVTTSEFPAYSTASFGCSYESDRAYLLFTVFNTSDTYATKAYRYNTFTQAWTSWNVSSASAIVNPVVTKNKLYLGAGDSNTVEIERKALSRKDYADKEYPIQFLESGLNGSAIQVSTVSNIEIGDMISQTQYLTASQFERLLLKLDTDTNLIPLFNNFYNTFKLDPTDNIARKLRNLSVKLNSLDPAYTVTSGTNNFATAQTEFNALVAQLNTPSTLTASKTYQTSSGTVEYEILVKDFSFYDVTITTSHISPILAGNATVFKGIKSKVVWAPISFGDPTMLKHVREGKFLFEHTTLSDASIGFASDLSPAFEEISFEMENDGSWGNNVYSNFTWGGFGNAIPLRTLIPRQKQRCTFIESLFKHQNAFYKFSILGIGYVYEMTSERGYR